MKLLNFPRSARMQKGFTLVELLVVVAIIAILMAMGIASFTNAQLKSRDARRKADMKAIQASFEQYYAGAGNNSYSTTCATMAASIPGGMPLDPKNVAPYQYSLGTSCTSTTAYCVCARLEGATGNASDGACTYVNTGAGSHFCVSQLQ